MPIDASIPLQVQPVKIESGANQLAMMESAAKMQEMTRQREVRNMLSNVDPNSPDAMKQIWAYDPSMAMDFASKQAALKTAALTQQKTQGDIFANNVKQAKDALPGVIDQRSYDAWRENFKDKMPPGYTLPDQYSHQVKTGLMYDAKSYIDANVVSANTNATNQTRLNIHNAGALNQANIADPYGISGIKPVLAGPSGVITNAPVANNLAPSTMPLNAPVTTSSVPGSTMPVANAPKITVKEAIGQGLQGDAFLSTLPPTVQSKLKAIAEYRMAPIPAGSRAPGAQQMTELLSYAYPEYDAKNYHSMNTAQKAFTSGKQGNSTRSFNVVVDHLSTLSQLNDAIANGDMPLINTLANTISTQTGQPAPNSFDAVKRIVGDEITKAVIGAGGALGDRKEVADRLSAANSPAQFKGVVKAYTDLMAGQLSGLETQYKASTGKDDYREKFLTPKTRQALAGKSGTPNAASLPAGVGADWVLKTDAKGNKAYVSPDNSKFVEVK